MSKKTAVKKPEQKEAKTVINEIELLSLATFVEKSYLDYSMYVVLDRAVPHVEDGLKPVQRRIIYAMSELGLTANAKPKKSARTVGDVIGKYHPHGDAPVYEAMVTLAQPFSYRYTLVDGQGNWGSPDDPKSFASSRYTEAKLTPYAASLLSELDQGTVDWRPNFDGTFTEPTLMPARLPNILINGGMGIAVGMATDIPSHNIPELVAACQHLLKNPKSTVADLMQFVPGPDFATGCEITSNKADLLKAYQTGNGMIQTRARWVQEDDGNIVITHLPHQVSPSKIQEQIAEQMRNKKLPMVEDMRDESDYENPTRIVVIPRSNRVDATGLMNHLFATTDLQKGIKLNLNMIGLDGRPKVKNLVEILSEWLTYRITTVRRRLNHRLAQVNARLHILDALLIAFLNIDEVIKIIREYEDPHAELVARFGLTDIQAAAILDIKLRFLAKLEEIKIKGEQEELAKEKAKLEALLASETKMKNLVSKELEEDGIKYGDPRRSNLVERPLAQAMAIEDITPAETITVILSKAGWIRSAKGHGVGLETLSYKTGDTLLAAVEGKNNQALVLFDDAGRAYTLNARELPSARGQGEPVTTKLDLQPGSKVAAMVLDVPESKYVLSSASGYGFVVTLGELTGRNRAGKAALSTSTGILQPLAVKDPQTDLLAIATNVGKCLVFKISDLPELSKGKGNKLINLKDGESIAGMAVLSDKSGLVIKSLGREMTLKSADVATYLAARAGRGMLLPRGYTKVEGLRAETV